MNRPGLGIRWALASVLLVAAAIGVAWRVIGRTLQHGMGLRRAAAFFAAVLLAMPTAAVAAAVMLILIMLGDFRWVGRSTGARQRAKAKWFS